MADGRVPVTLLAGFLGAGKTTLLNRILAEVSERVAVVVNEFGDVGIDGSLIVGADDEVVELSNGCVCCTIRGDLQQTVKRLLARRRRIFRRLRFDRILIEGSGLASPGPVVQTFLLDPDLDAATKVDGVVTVVNAVEIARQLEEHPEAADQVGYADRVLLNHVDRCDEAGLDAAEAAVRARNGVAEVVRSVRAEVPVAPLLSIGGLDGSRWSMVAASAAHTQGVATRAVSSDRPLDLEELKLWLHFLAAGRGWELLRVKGIVRCVGHRRPVVVQGVHQWLEIGPGEGAPPEQSRLVFIGRDLPAELLERGWAAALR